MNGTFSSNTHGTGWRLSRRNTSPTSPDRSPAIPRVVPAWLRSWQGKPAVSSSVPEGRDRISLTSSVRSTSGIRALRTALAPGSFSQRIRVRWPALWRPTSMPPMPAKKAAIERGGRSERGWVGARDFNGRNGVLASQRRSGRLPLPLSKPFSPRYHSITRVRTGSASPPGWCSIQAGFAAEPEPPS